MGKMVAPNKGSNFLFKIITKILADRLSTIASRIVCPNQFGFIRGRRIHECIAMASEAVNQLERKNGSRNMIVKLDIKKAFDAMSWNFIITVLKSFGFDEKFRDWILAIFKSAIISILHNGSPFGLFRCSKGIRQGDPLSPLLFGIAEDFLSRYMLKLCELKVFAPCTSSRHCFFPSHLFYADDVPFFWRASKKKKTFSH